ncbi:MAG: DevR family CRISPR-associated autoregulator [Chloroflexi bacterium]|nr:DevR family CRISPR-associated autoregulator [Chloroflexota bacterium]
MSPITSVAVSARVILNLHSLNNEGTEGNQQQTRMVHILDQAGQRAVVNAISGDTFKHMLVEHLIPLLEAAGQPLSPGARLHSADRINAENPEFVEFCDKEQDFGVSGRVERRRARDSEVVAKLLGDCALTDIAGTLVTTSKRAVGRKSTVEFGWVVGLPEKTVTEQYFHVKYAPEGRGQATGGETVAERQAIFHRPASSGEYALVCNLDLWRIGLNDITRKYDVPEADRNVRASALLHALGATLLKPTGAQRNTQHPHVVSCRGVVAVSTTSLPAPVVSPLADDFQAQVEQAKAVCNRIWPESVRVIAFGSLAEGVSALVDIAQEFGPSKVSIYA